MSFFADYRIRDVVGFLGTFVLMVNIIGYIGGYMLVDFNVRWNNSQRKLQVVKSEFSYLETGENDDALETDKYATAEGSLDFKTHAFHPRRPTTTTEGMPTQGPTTQGGLQFPNPLTANVGIDGKSMTNDGLHLIRRVGSTTAGPLDYPNTVIQSSAPCRYETSRSKTDGRWYNFTSGTARFYAYTAFLDDRPSLKTGPVVRIIALTTRYEIQVHGVELLCQLYYETTVKNGARRRLIVPMERPPRPIGHGWPLNREIVREYIYTCPLIGDSAVSSVGLPVSVSVVTSGGNYDPAVTSCMPVERPTKPTAESAVENFAICVQVAYDNVDPYRLIEWLELQRLLGVSFVGIYNLSVAEPASTVLRSYADEGFVVVRKTDYIAHGPQQYLLHGSPVINDCVYRHMYRFRRMLVVDFDEAILPRSPNTNLLELVASVERSFIGVKSPPPVNFMFRNNYFFLEATPDAVEDPRFPILRYRQRAPTSPVGYSVKSIIDPQSCIQMHNHYCWKVTAGYEDRGYLAFVSGEHAVNQHYKSCHFSSDECRNYLTQSVRDDTIEPFKARLKVAVDAKVKLIFPPTY